MDFFHGTKEWLEFGAALVAVIGAICSVIIFLAKRSGSKQTGHVRYSQPTGATKQSPQESSESGCSLLSGWVLLCLGIFLFFLAEPLGFCCLGVGSWLHDKYESRSAEHRQRDQAAQADREQRDQAAQAGKQQKDQAAEIESIEKDNLNRETVFVTSVQLAKDYGKAEATALGNNKADRAYRNRMVEITGGLRQRPEGGELILRGHDQYSHVTCTIKVEDAKKLEAITSSFVSSGGNIVVKLRGRCLGQADATNIIVADCTIVAP